MVKLNRLMLGLWVVGLLLVSAGSSAHGNDRGEAKATVGSAKVSIDYGRPMLKGRDMIKKLQPGQLWRIGADAPTTLESDADLDFGGTRVPKGKHILLARLIQPGQWSLVFSTKDAFHYEPSAKIAEVPLQFQEATAPAEMVTIELRENGGRGEIEFAWGTMRLLVSFTPAR